MLRCHASDTALVAGHRVMLLEVVLLEETGPANITARPFMRQDGCAVYRPLLFTEDTWDDIAGNATVYAEDIGICTEVPDHLVDAGSCHVCDSDISLLEPSGYVTYGTIVRSPQSPDNQPIHLFSEHAHQESYLVCLACLRNISEELCTLWDSISYAGECSICTQERNWRENRPCTHLENHVYGSPQNTQHQQYQQPNPSGTGTFNGYIQQ